MADYINTTNTIGFYKFSNSTDWAKNSILNPSIYLPLQGFKRVNTSNNQWGDTVFGINPTFTKGKYKSRPFAINLTESTGITINNINLIANCMTTEFWFYPERGSNLTDPNQYHNVYPNAIYQFTADASNPFLFVLNITQNYSDRNRYYTGDYCYRVDTGGTSSNTSIHRDIPIYLNLGYCCYKERFEFQAVYQGSDGASSPQVRILTATKNYCPSNRWYHVAITQQQLSERTAKICLFINGSKVTEMNIDSGSTAYSTSKGVKYKYYHYNKLKMGLCDHISIGNRCYRNNGIYAYQYYGPNNPSSNNNNAMLYPGFQNIIIDDLRISNSIVYTENFTPPGISGYQLVYINGDVYGYDDTYQFVKIASDWDNKTSIQKQSIINTMGFVDLSIEDIKTISTNPSDNIHIEVYATDSLQKTCEIPESSYETIVKPSELLPNPLPGSDIKKIDFTYSISTSTNSAIKVLLTTDLETYKTYNFELNSWVNTPLEDISSYGIPIDQVKNIPEADVMSLGDNFAFAYFLHLEPYEADCNINKLALDVSLTYAQKHCNQSIANYEYPMFNKLKVIFYEDGEFKVNYMDKP